MKFLNFQWDSGSGWGYICQLEGLDVDSPDFLIQNIVTEHKTGKADFNVTTIDIVNSNLNFLPKFNPETLKKLPSAIYLAFNGAAEVAESLKLDDKSLEGFSILHSVSLIGLKIKNLPANLLHNLPEMWYFDARKNEIVSIPDNFFEQNPKLQEVYLYENRIVSLPENLFKNNFQLRKISIYTNKIKFLPPNLLGNLQELNSFSAYNNEIESIPQNFFEQNTNLEYVYLYGNRIASLPENLFANNRKLKVIHIHM